MSLEKNPQEWYERYVEGKESVSSPQAHIGNAIDLTMGQWAEFKRKHQNEGTPMPDTEYFQKFFDNIITGQLEPAEALIDGVQDVLAAGKHWFKDGVDKNSPHYERYLRARQAAGMFTERFKDWQVYEVDDPNHPGQKKASYQMLRHPNFGDLPDGSGQIKSVGWVDLGLIDPQGRKVDFDLKPIRDYWHIES